MKALEWCGHRRFYLPLVRRGARKATVLYIADTEDEGIAERTTDSRIARGKGLPCRYLVYGNIYGVENFVIANTVRSLHRETLGDGQTSSQTKQTAKDSRVEKERRGHRYDVP